MEFIIDIQNSMLYYIIRQVLACIFYSLLLIYLFTKIRNMFLIKKFNCKDEYTVKKKEFSNQIKEKIQIAKIIGIILLVFIILCIIFGGILLFTNIIILIFTGFGTALAFSDNPFITFIKNLMNLSLNIFEYIPVILFCLMPILFYGLVFYILIKGIYVNINIQKFFKLKNNIQ